MKLENKLSNYKSKTITKDKISELINEYSDEALYEQINDCCKNGFCGFFVGKACVCKCRKTIAII